MSQLEQKLKEQWAQVNRAKTLAEAREAREAALKTYQLIKKQKEMGL